MALDFRNIHILIVEDLPPMRKVISQTLKMLGFGQISRARDGVEGYEAYLREKPDIILTDWQMPNMDGLELTKKIRQHPSSPNRTIPIIMMTGFCAKERISESLECGVSSFLVKPFSAKDIAKRVTHIIQNPSDFLVSDVYVGPHRGGKNNCSSDKGNEDETCEIIKADHSLQERLGKGVIDPMAIVRAQKAIDENKIDFFPIAKFFIGQLSNAIDQLKSEKEPTRKALVSVIDPIMQIKANARIFKYNTMGDLADTILTFLENINEPDEFVMQIIDANQKTLKHLVDREGDGDYAEDDESLVRELEEACKRYMNIRTHLSKKKLEKIAAKS